MISMGWLLGLSCLLSVTFGLDPIEIRGSKFFNKATGNQFFFKGITYQPKHDGVYDPLAIPKFCSRDVAYLKDLGINAIRVYESYPWNDHSQCMRIFKDNDIYVILDLPIPDKSINRINPKYDIEIFNHIKATIDEFYHYENLMLFVIGNEVVNSWETSGAASFVKAALRDAKHYLRTLPRYVPVGYADIDLPFISEHTRAFMTCGDINHRADFYGINLFSWCGESDMEKSNYKKKLVDYGSTDIPIIITEYGCNDYSPRPFSEISAIYGEEMTKVFSGGFIHEYSNSQRKFGLVNINKGEVSLTTDYENVKTQLASVNPMEITRDEYIPLGIPIPCPQVTNHWLSNSNLPPTPSEFACNCVEQTLSCRAIASTGHEGIKIGKIIDRLCSLDSCHDIHSDSRIGAYGRYSFCDAQVKNSIVFNNIVKKFKENCDFEGKALVHTPFTNIKEESCEAHPNLNKAIKPAVPSDDKTMQIRQDSENYKYSTPNSSAQPLTSMIFITILVSCSLLFFN